MDLFAEYIFHNINRNKQLRMPSLLCTVTKSCSENNNGIIRECLAHVIEVQRAKSGERKPVQCINLD